MTPPIRRPRILVKAAKIALDHYERDAGLARLLKLRKTPDPDVALARLSEVEDALNTERLQGAATYSIERHIQILTALLAEIGLIERKALA
ncbi:MAG: DUF6477 family protein [Pseudomonadota bacterium]